MGWNRYLIWSSLSPQGRGFSRTLHSHLNWVFFIVIIIIVVINVIIRALGEAAVALLALSSSSPPHRLGLQLYWFGFVCSFPSLVYDSCPHFPAAKPQDLLSVSPLVGFPRSQSHSTFPLILFPRCRSETPQHHFSLLHQGQNQSINLSLNPPTPPFPSLLSAAGTLWDVQSMLCCRYPGTPDSGSGQLLFTLCAGAAPCLSLLVWWVSFGLFLSFLFLPIISRRD